MVENLPDISYNEDDKKTIYAEDVNRANAEIQAIEQTLGVGVAGEYQTLTDRLADMGGGGGNWELIHDHTMLTDGNDYTIGGLDLEADGVYRFDFLLVNKEYSNGWTWSINGQSGTYYGQGVAPTGSALNGTSNWGDRLVSSTDLNPEGHYPCWGYIRRAPFGGVLLVGDSIIGTAANIYPIRGSFAAQRMEAENMTSLKISPTQWYIYEGSRFRVWREVL